MIAACLPHATHGRFITAMAAVAGSVAEERFAIFDRPGITRDWINNGGNSCEPRRRQQATWHAAAPGDV